MKLVCVVGPTGCGKTWLGVELAKMLGGEVVSCDSMQIYRGMLIGTAAPTAEEMQGVPHHMVGVADPRENYSVARYADDAAKCVDDILSRGKQPVIVGGTGLYFKCPARRSRLCRRRQGRQIPRGVGIPLGQGGRRGDVR